MRQKCSQKRTFHNLINTAGITLIEVMIVLLIITVIAAGLIAALGSSWQSQMTLTNQNEMQRRAQNAVDTIIDSMRGYSAVEGGTLTSITAAQRNKDGELLRTISYYLLNGELRRDTYDAISGDSTAGEQICDSISALQFDYQKYDASTASWESPATPSEATSIRVSLTVTSGKDHATETSWVKFRNSL